MSVLQSAVASYRSAAIAAGLPWPEDRDPANRLTVDALCRIFDVDRIAEQPVWVQSQLFSYERVLPGGAHSLPWEDASELLDLLSFSVGVPFHWRHQLPMFFVDHLVFTFVLAGENEGEIWRYQIDADDWNPVRAAPGLAALFTAWTQGFAAGVYQSSPYDTWLHIEDGVRDPVDLLLQRSLDPFAFPVHLSGYSHRELIQARQRECGVDLDAADDPGLQGQLIYAIDTVRRTLT